MKRLKYISRFSKKMSSGEIKALVRDAAVNNKEKEITGVIMASGGLFFQIIEGPTRNIDALWSKIVKDKRHKDVLLLNTEENVKDRLFSKWSMQQISLDSSTDLRAEPLKIILQTIFQQSEIIQELTRALEKSVWHFLVDPEKK